MANNDSPKQLTVGQLIDALGQCDRDDLVKVVYEGGYKEDVAANLVFVERANEDVYGVGSEGDVYGQDYVVYLHTEYPNFIHANDNVINGIVEIRELNEIFAETTRDKIIENL